MNETAIVYIVHSDLDENNIFAMFEDEVEAIMYARRHKEDLTYVDKTEMSLDESGDYDEVLSAETIWVYDEDEDPEDIEDEPELSDEDLFDIDFDELERELDGEESWFEDLATDKLVETLEENEDIVECKECFELFPKEACTKIAIGYICPECGKVHGCCMDDEEEFEIDSIPDVVIADEDTFKIDFPEVERVDYGNDMIPDEPTPEVENDPISEPQPEPECVGPECEAPVEAPVTKDETITKLVVDEHEAIDGYDKAKIEIEANSELDKEEKEEILDTIEHIKEEEIEHIEELEELVDEVEETKVDEPAEDLEETEEHEVLTEEVLTEWEVLNGVGRAIKGAARTVFGANPDKYWVDLKGEAPKFPNEKGPHQGYNIKQVKLKNGKLETTGIVKNTKDYAEAEKVASAESKRAQELYLITPKGEKKEYDYKLALYKDGKLTDSSKEWKQAAINSKNAEAVNTKKDPSEQKLEWKLNITEIAVGEEKELKVLNGEDKEIKPTIYKLSLPDDDTVPNVELDTTKRILKGISIGKAKIKIIRIDTEQTVDVNIEVKKAKEENQEVAKPNPNENRVDTSVTSKKSKNAATKQYAALLKIITAIEKEESIVDIMKLIKEAGLDTENTKVSEFVKKVESGEIKSTALVVGKKVQAAFKALRKELFTESLEEHVNEEHPAIESDQVLVGTDNAVVDCKVNKVITHSEDEKPVDCKGEKKPLEKPLTESLSKDQLQAMEDYLKSTKFASLDTEWEDEGDFYIDECSAYLDYSAKTKTFTLGLSIYHASEDNNAEYPEDHTDEEEYSYDSLTEMYEDEECREILDMLYEENERDFTESLTEETHAKYAKPEGNRVQAFNNALKYAKKENKPFIYGYTNHTGKFFAAETPMKVTGSPAEAEKEFKSRYKNCSVIYVVYPDKEFIREGLFTKQEQEEYNMDEDGHSLDSYDTYIRCGFCDEIYTKSECKYERNLGWLCPSCEAAIYSRGEKLTFVDPDEFLEN